MTEVAKLPTGRDRLERDAKRAWRAQRDAKANLGETQIAFDRKPSDERQRAVELAKLDHSRARRAWIKAEDTLREAGS